jgi:hypothetical protein
MELFKDFDITLSSDDVLRGEGADPVTVRARRPELVKTASAALEEGLSKLHPVAIIHKLKVVEHRHEKILLHGGIELISRLVVNHLSGAEEVVLVICTIGSQLETFASSCMQENPLLGLALDGLGNAAIENVAQQVCGRIGEQARVGGLSASTPLSPGEPEWPVEIGHPFIFSLLDPSLVGITLSSGGMMLPKKSVSFVVGVGPGMLQGELCDLCSLHERCRYRHA